MRQKLKSSNRQSSSKREEGGFAALIVIMVAATLALLSVEVIDYGKIANRVSTEKQLLDSHGHLVGHSIINLGLEASCSRGVFSGEVDEVSAALFGEMNQVNQEDRAYRCEALDDGELIVREPGDPDGPPGSFRRYRVTSDYNSLTGDTDQEEAGDVISRSVIVEVREIETTVQDARPQIMFVLDYSGSMKNNGKHIALKNAMQHFVDANYEIDYGVVLFESHIIDSKGVSHGNGHHQEVMSKVNVDPGGGTQFKKPLEEATEELRRSYNPYSYIVLVSDGLPGDKDDAQTFVNSNIRNIDPDNCTMRRGDPACITIYTLSVDNVPEGKRILTSLSGNAATTDQKREDYMYDIRDPANTEVALKSILDEILCAFGPLESPPAAGEEDTVRVFINDDLLPNDGEHYSYDSDTNQVFLYDVDGGRQACTEAINHGKLTVRYGKPRIIVE